MTDVALELERTLNQLDFWSATLCSLSRSKGAKPFPVTRDTSRGALACLAQYVPFVACQACYSTPPMRFKRIASSRPL